MLFRFAPEQKINFRKKFPEADPLAIDLMEKMLQFDPRKRVDVHQALKHPWLAQLHDEAAEPSAPGERLLECCRDLCAFHSGEPVLKPHTFQALWL